MKKFFSQIFPVVLLLSSSTLLFAGGFEPSLTGARQLGMGNTGTALIQGASSLLYNPAALVLNDNRFNIHVATNALWESSVYYDATSGITARTIDKINYSGSGYMFFKPVRSVAIGFGVYKPYGINTNWEEPWKGRFVVQNYNFQVTNYQPTVSVKVSKRLSFGAGLVFSVMKMTFNKDIPLNSVSGKVSALSLLGKSNGTTGNLGLFYQASDRLRLGLTYKAGLRYKITGAQVTTSVPGDLADSYPSANKFNSSIPLPDVFTVGASYYFTKRFVVSADISFNQWSVYKEQYIDFDKNTDLFKDITFVRKWENTRSYRFGIQYLKSCCLSFRAGISYDESPVNLNNFLPDIIEGGQVSFTGGLGYDFNDHWSIDGAAIVSDGTQVEGNYHSIDYRGFYKTRSFGGVFGLTYVF